MEVCIQMKTVLLTTIVFIFTLQVCGYAVSNGPTNQRKIQAPNNLDDYVQTVMKTFDVPGVALAIVKDGKIVVAKGYGLRQIGQNAQVDNETLFGIASNTKAFTATALAILVEEGKVNWDDPVVNYLPWFRMSDPYVTSQLTVRDLLVHRSGLGLGAGDLLWWPQSDYTRREIVRHLSAVPLSTSFRSTFAYDNVLYLVAGELIEAVTGMSWEKFVKSYIIDKIGMAGTINDVSLLLKEKDVAVPHAFVGNKLVPVKPYIDPVTNPAGGICSNATDIARWMIVQLDSGRVQDTTRIFHPSTTVQLWSLVTPIKVPKVPDFLSPMQRNFYGYGLGFFISDYRGYKLVSHTGSLPGYASQIALIPALKLGVAVLTNQESVYAFNSITYHVLDYYLNAPQFDWIAGFKMMKAKDDSSTAALERVTATERDSTSGPSLPLQKYAGTYRDAWYGDVFIEYQSGKLTVKFSHTPQLAGELVHWQYDTFLARWRDRELRADAFVTFELNADGTIDRVKMQPASPATDFSFDFQDLLLKPVNK